MSRTSEQIIAEIHAIVGGALDTRDISSIADRVVEWDKNSPPAEATLPPVFLSDMNGRLVEVYSEGHTPPPLDVR